MFTTSGMSGEYQTIYILQKQTQSVQPPGLNRSSGVDLIQNNIPYKQGKQIQMFGLLNKLS